MSEEFTLEDAIAAAFEEAPQEVEKPAEEELTPPTDDTPPEEPEDTGEPEEEPDSDVLAKLEQLEQEHGTIEEDDPWVNIKSEEQFLIQEQEALKQGFLNGLPVIKDDEGQSIYEMPPDKFDKFLQTLGDDGKESLKHEALQARKAAIDAATKHIERQNQFNERVALYNQGKLQVEVITDVAKQLGLPELVKAYQKGDVKRVLEDKAQNDPKIAQHSQTKEGLYKLAALAVRELGLVQSKNPEPKTPSAPDAKAASKKVKTQIDDNSDEALLAKVSKMSTREYGKLDEKTRERLMYASLRNAIN